MAFKKHNYISERIMNVIKKNVLLYHYLNLRSQFSYVLILIFLSNKSGVECVFFFILFSYSDFSFRGSHTDSLL